MYLVTANTQACFCNFKQQLQYVQSHDHKMSYLHYMQHCIHRRLLWSRDCTYFLSFTHFDFPGHLQYKVPHVSKTSHYVTKCKIVKFYNLTCQDSQSGTRGYSRYTRAFLLKLIPKATNIPELESTTLHPKA